MKFCKDCGHAVMGSSYDYGCVAGETRGMVWGNLIRPWALKVREDENLCGKDAKWFVQRSEPEEVEPLPKPEGPKNTLEPRPEYTLGQKLKLLFK